MIWNWYKYLLWLAVFVLFLIEGALMPWLLPNWANEMQFTIVPHFSLILIIYIAIYLNRPMGLAMSLVFGILTDIIFYGHVLGAYAFGMGLATYLIAIMLRDSHVSWYIGIGSIGLGLILFDVFVYGIYMLFQISAVSPWWFFMHRTVPSLLLNLCFASALYYPLIKFFARIEKYVAPEEQEAYPTGNP